MRLAPLLFLACTLAPSIISAQATGSVSGHVICADTRTPCRFATITLQSTESLTHATPKTGAQQKKGSTYTGVTGLDGPYQINGVAPGDYYVMPLLPGYLNLFDQLL